MLVSKVITADVTHVGGFIFAERKFVVDGIASGGFCRGVGVIRPAVKRRKLVQTMNTTIILPPLAPTPCLGASFLRRGRAGFLLS